MIILREKKSQPQINEGTWRIPQAGQEVASAVATIAKANAFAKNIPFGSDSLSDVLADLRASIWEEALMSFITNTARSLYPKRQKLSSLDSEKLALEVFQQVQQSFGKFMKDAYFPDRKWDKRAIVNYAMQYNGW